MKTEVYTKGPARSWWGQSLPRQVLKTSGAISAGLATRLQRYASNRLNDAGMLESVTGWSMAVYTIDGEETSANRSYCVRWENEKGGYIEVVGILTRSGWPFLDHGLSIEG